MGDSSRKDQGGGGRSLVIAAAAVVCLGVVAWLLLRSGQGTSPNAEASTPGATVILPPAQPMASNISQPWTRTQIPGFDTPDARRVMLERGQKVYGLYCAACHGQGGLGNGIAVMDGAMRPPSFHQQRIREEPVGRIYRVITLGQGQMPALGDSITASDRWSVIAYIRALQRAFNGRLSDVPPDQRTRLAQEP